MPTTIPVFPPTMPAYSPAANAMGMQMLFSSDFFAVVLFSIMGLFITLVAAVYGEQGIWL
jgi:hypothetical protein